MANTWGRLSLLLSVAVGCCCCSVEKSLVEEEDDCSKERVAAGQYVAELSAVNFFVLVEKELMLL